MVETSLLNLDSIDNRASEEAHLASLESSSNTAISAINMATGSASGNQGSGIRLPPFSKDNPDLWFNQVERILARNKITSASSAN